MPILRFVIVALSVAVCANLCLAQVDVASYTYDFVPRETIIFEDDFSNDAIGQFPSRWHLHACNDIPNYERKQLCKVRKSGDEFVLAIPEMKRYIYFEPNVGSDNYLNDSFTIEFDFLKEKPDANCSITFPFLNQILFSGTLNGMGIGLRGMTGSADFKVDLGYYMPKRDTHVYGIYPVEFRETEWHHFALSLCKKEVKGYLDQYRLIKFDDNTLYPKNFALQLGGPIKIKNFKLTTGRAVSTFTPLLTTSRFVTHAIHFDVNKSDVKPESMGFIVQFAQFLRANPNIKIEIGGHTDSDGDAEANKKLSHARADEVRRQLIALGIEVSRLTTKGFGAAVPLEPNTTWQGRAKNRRVEFVRL